MRREIDSIVVHCADTPNGRRFVVPAAGENKGQIVWVDIKDIDKWHAERGFARQSPQTRPHLKAVGYHAVIGIGGDVAYGRAFQETGAHAGHNSLVANANKRSLGICLIGKDAFTIAQWYALRDIITDWKMRHPITQIVGHRDIASHKQCPGFDVSTWVLGGMEPLDNHIVFEQELTWPV